MHRFSAATIVPWLLVAGLAVAGAAQAAQPDLKVRVRLKKQQQPSGKWFVRMRFQVFNAGGAMAGPSVVGAWCVANAGGPCPPLDGHYDLAPPVEPGGTAVVRLATPAIPPGASVVVNGPATQEWQPGHYTIKAKADFPEALAESIEANNDGRATVSLP